MEIILPRYEAVLENTVYQRESITHPGEDWKDFLILNRYIQSTEEAMVERLMAALTFIDGLEPGKPTPVRISSLEASVAQSLKPPTIKHLVKGTCSDCFELIKRCSPALISQEGQEFPTYFQAIYGTIPEEALAIGVKTGENMDALWYEGALHHPLVVSQGAGIQLFAEIELEEGAFPVHYKEKLVIESRGRTSLKTINDITAMLKRNFDTAERILMLTDYSPRWLEKSAIRPMAMIGNRLNLLSAKHEGKSAVSGNPFAMPEIKAPDPKNKLN